MSLVLLKASSYYFLLDFLATPVCPGGQALIFCEYLLAADKINKAGLNLNSLVPHSFGSSLILSNNQPWLMGRYL